MSEASAAKRAQKEARRPTSGRPLFSATLRGQVELKCNLQPPEADDEVSLILWYKDNSMVPIYSVDARATPVREARHKPGAWLEGRANLRIVEQSIDSQQQGDEQQAAAGPRNQLRRRRKTRDWLSGSGEEETSEMEMTNLGERLEGASSAPSGRGWLPEPQAQLSASRTGLQQRQQQLVARLRIDSLSSEDNGLYKCRVDFRRSRSRIEEAELRIIIPAERPTIRDVTPGAAGPSRWSPGAPTQLVGPHNEGARVVLECETSGGYPEPSVSWWRDGKLLDDSYEVVSAADGLVLERRAGPKLAGELDEPPAGTPTAAELPDEPSPFDSSGQSDDSLGAESSRAASSEITGTSPATNSPAAGPSAAPNRLIRNRLELAAVTRDDLLANYSCAARNSKLGPAPTSYVMIDMNLRPLRVQIDNERAPVLAGKPLEVVCRTFGSRPAALISWHLGETKLAPATTPDERKQTTRAGGQRRPAADKVSISESISADSNVTSSRLTFVPQLEHSGQLLVCRAENGFIGPANTRAAGFTSADFSLNELAAESRAASSLLPATLEDSWKLEVHYLPRVKLSLGDKLQGRPVQVGHDVYFECSAQAQPAAREPRWWFNGKELETNVSSGVIISNQSLVLQRVSRQQRGHYTCSASNAVGEAQSNSVHLRVQHPPHCRDSLPSRRQLADGDNSLELDQEPGEWANSVGSSARHKTHFGAARLETVRVHCRVDADPSDALSFKWAFVAKSGEAPGEGPPAASSSGKPEWSGQQLVYLEPSLAGPPAAGGQLESVLSYTPKSELDYGTLLCWAANALGQQAEPCVYQVLPAERPEPVRNCRLLNASFSQLAVACEPGYDGGIQQSFHMEVYDSRRRELVANLTNIPGLSSDLFSEQTHKNQEAATAAAGKHQDELESNQLNDQEARGEPSEQQTTSAPSEPLQSSAGQRQLAASLVSETMSGELHNQSQSRQQKQRHSLQSHSQSHHKGAGGKQLKSLEAGQEGERDTREAVFLTEPQLAPATDYLLTIYSSNAKGASRPISLAASTSNLTAPLNSAASSFWPIFGSTQARRPGQRALMNEMFALSWSPFLLVCAVTLLIFVLFASVTFALIKYVDLAGVLLPAHSNKRGDGGLDPDRKSPGARQQPNGQTVASHDGDNSSDSYPDNRTQQQQQQQQREAAGSPGYKRARVIAIGNWPAQSSRLSAERELEIPLNGVPTARADRSSLLNGSFLRSKLQQLTTGAGQQSYAGGARIKQSNSDNFLNQTALLVGAQGAHSGQMGAANQAAPGTALALAARDANWALGYRPAHQQLAAAHQAAYYAGGTLPRHHQTPLLETSAGSNAYGYLKVISASGQQTRLMPAGHLELLAGGGSPPASMSSPPTGHLQHQQQQQPRAAPVEHLLISGKQYIHQTRAQSHLQMTSAAALEQQQQLNYMAGASDGQRAAQAALPQYLDEIQYCAASAGAQGGPLELSNAATKTSDLGDDDDDHQHHHHEGLMRHAFAQQPTHGGQLNFADSDGMSSQGTQRSLNTTGTQANSAATNGSPSSGLGQDLANCSHCQLEGDTLPAPYAAMAAYHQQGLGSSASSTLASASESAANQHQPNAGFDLNYNQLSQQDVELLPMSVELAEQQHQDQLFPYGTLKPAAKTAAALRTNKKSLTFDPNVVPIGARMSLDSNNNERIDQPASGGQFYLIQSAGEHNNNSDPLGRTRAGLANMKTRVRLVDNERSNQNVTQMKSTSSGFVALDSDVSMAFLGADCEGCREHESSSGDTLSNQLHTDV